MKFCLTKTLYTALLITVGLPAVSWASESFQQIVTISSVSLVKKEVSVDGLRMKVIEAGPNRSELVGLDRDYQARPLSSGRFVTGSKVVAFYQEVDGVLMLLRLEKLPQSAVIAH